MLEFPNNFFWGAATSSYQVEGDNANSDWWEWEKRVGLKDISGRACRQYELYKEDFDLAKKLNHNCHRLSIEWSRIEPEEGHFSDSEINHYIDVVLSLKERNLEPIITLHHFTNPLWLAKKGGWHSKKVVDYFLRYAFRVVHALGDKVNYWVTINEPMVYMYHSYILGDWPPQKKSILKAKMVMDNFINAHIKTYKLIHDYYRQNKFALPSVSIAANVVAFEPCSLTLKNKVATYLRDKLFNLEFIERLIRYKSLDFLGINYYTRELVDVQNWGFLNLMLDTCKKDHLPLKKNSLGWAIYPEGLYQLLLRFKRYDLAIFILENGICTADDSFRWDFIHRHLENIHLAITEGVKVLGYIYWSLIDNFEWDKGFGPRFGLIDVDYNTYIRTIRDSANKFALVCKTGKLD